MNEGKERSLENLISFDKMSEDKQKEIATQGGYASGVARRRKKLLREYLEIMLAKEDREGVDKYTKITQALIDKAEDGDTKAYEVVRDTLGQKPKEEVEQKQEIKIVMDDDTKEWGQ